MQRPRRTTEYETPSGKPLQSRTSRLQQPIRRPSIRRDGSLPRSSSAEPLNSLFPGTGNHLNVPSTSTKRHRSSSVSNARTPQRTPTHITPSKGAQFTGEKQRAAINDKRWIQEQIVRITEFLKGVDCGINTEFLNRGGLKTMSMKQFIGLVDYFLKFIAGNKFKVGSNHVESISKILNQIDYPYTVNKSWLKTPTAPHAFGNVVMLFSFFMDFIPPADNIEVFKKDYLIASEEFPDKDFAIKLSDMAEEGFSLWNNQKNEEFEKLQKIAVDELICKKISIPSSDAVDEAIKRLNIELDEISAKAEVIETEDEYFRLDKEVKTNQRRIEKLQKLMQENQKIIDKLEYQINGKQELIEKLRLSVEEIRSVISTQKMSIEERNKLIEEVGQKQYQLQTKQKAVCDLQEKDNQLQIQLARQIKLLTEKLAQFNSYIREIMADLKNLSFINLKVDIESLCLHQNSELETQIQRVEEFLKKLKLHLTNQMADLSEQIENYEKQIKLISYEISNWIEPNSKEKMQTIKKIQKEVDELDREIIATTNFTTNRIAELDHRVKQSEEALNSLRNSIEHNRQEILKTQEENEAMMKLVTERFEEYFKTKDALLKQFQEALQQCQKKCTEAKVLLKK
ncbi:kinectin [Eupeodes corollae]|uniref:kinectin n=1 Tax=Eupeodes corollae TaxID=290404 RepID=UPI0024913BE8|nr:kinectin [Eupeodes corollae]